MAEAPVTRGFVLVVGPDGAGKSTVVDAIVARAQAAGVRVSRAHYRPGLIAGRGEVGPVTAPHSAPARSILASLAKLAVVFCDHLVGGNTRWRGQRRTGLLLLERGWFDLAVDPCRYRVPVVLVGLVGVLGRLLPRPDLVLLLTGDAVALHGRKPEIGVAEVARQIQRWRRVAPSAGRRVVEVDTVATQPDAAAAAMYAALPSVGRSSVGESSVGQPSAGRSSVGQPWRRVPLTPGRLDLRMTGDARPALDVYQPQSPRARAAAVLWRGAGLRGRQVAEPIPQLPDLWSTIGIAPDGVVAMRSSAQGRLVLSAARDGRLQVIVKVGALADAALRHEARMLAAPLHPELAVGRPQLLWCGPWSDRFVVVTRAAQRCSTRLWTPHDVVPLAEALARAGADGEPLTHGDLAPWNLVRTAQGPVLLDWESARWADEPLHDLAHFVVQSGALLGRYGPERAVSLLCDEDSPGARLLRARGLDVADAGPLLGAYLAQARPSEPRAVRFRAEMLRLVPG